MSYAGNPATFPPSIPLLSDATPPSASEINVPIETQTDRTAFLKAEADKVRFLPAFHFNYAEATGVTESSRPFFVPSTRRWYMPAGGTLRLSRDGGNTWPEQFGIDLVIDGHDTISGDYDDGGAIVVTTEDRYVIQRSADGGSFTLIDVLGSDPGIDIDSRVVYDPVHARWVWFCAFVNALAVRHSTDRTTWTAATAPSSGTWGDDHEGGLARLACNRATGRIVAVAKVDGTATTASVATSDDGGATWTVRADITGLADSSDYAELVYNADEDEWLYSCGNTVTATSKVFRSVDGGATWTLVSTLTTWAMRSIAALGNVWYGLASQSGQAPTLVLSSDRGVTWRIAGMGTGSGSDGTVVASASFGGLVLVEHSHNVYTGLRVGTPDLGVLT